MTAKILTHKFQSTVPDGTDPSVVKPSAWDDDHNIWLGFRTVSSTSDALTQADHLSLITCTNAGATTIGVPAPASGNFPLGYCARVRCAGLGGVTLTGTGGATINGNPNISLAQNDAVDIYGTGTADFQAVAIRANPGVSSFNTLTGGVILNTANAPAGTRGGIGIGAAGQTFTLSRDPPPAFENLMVAASVAGGILTVSLKDAAGNDPSAASAPKITVVNSVLGSSTTYVVTAPVSLSTVVGASFGTQANVAFRLWVVALIAGGAVQLGLYQSTIADSVNLSYSVLPCDFDNPVPTAVLGAGSNAAGTIYTVAGAQGSAVPCRVLGYFEWGPNAIPTPGTFSQGPRKAVLMGPGIRRPGDIVQSGTTVYGPGNPGTSSTTFIQVAGAQLTPLNAANVVRVHFEEMIIVTASGDGCNAAIMRGATNNVGRISGVQEITGSTGSANPMGCTASLFAYDKPNVEGAAQQYSFQIRSGAGQPVYAGNGQPAFVELLEIMA